MPPPIDPRLSTAELEAALAAKRRAAYQPPPQPSQVWPPDEAVPAPDLGQLTREDMAAMTAEQIVEARRAGRFAALLGQPLPVDQTTSEENQ